MNHKQLCYCFLSIKQSLEETAYSGHTFSSCYANQSSAEQSVAFLQQINQAKDNQDTHKYPLEYTVL